MKKGDILNIEGAFGFLWSPKLIVLEIKGSLALVKSVDANEGGILSSFNSSWHGIDLLLKKIKK